MTFQQILLAVVCPLVMIGCVAPVSQEQGTEVSSASTAEQAPGVDVDIPPLPGFGAVETIPR